MTKRTPIYTIALLSRLRVGAAVLPSQMGPLFPLPPDRTHLVQVRGVGQPEGGGSRCRVFRGYTTLRAWSPSQIPHKY